MAVTLITDENFREQISLNNKVVVKYYADWCGSCKLFAPKFKRISNDPQFEGIAFLDVNAEQNPEARKAAGVTNLPYFAIFKDGELVETVASNKEDAVLDLIKKL